MAAENDEIEDFNNPIIINVRPTEDSPEKLTIFSKYTANPDNVEIIRNWIGLEGDTQPLLTALTPSFMAHLLLYSQEASPGANLGGYSVTYSAFKEAVKVLDQSEINKLLRAKPYRILCTHLTEEIDEDIEHHYHTQDISFLSDHKLADVIYATPYVSPELEFLKDTILLEEREERERESRFKGSSIPELATGYKLPADVKTALLNLAFEDLNIMWDRTRKLDVYMLVDLYLHRPSDKTTLGLHTDSSIFPGISQPPARVVNSEDVDVLSLLYLAEDKEQLLKSTTIMTSDIGDQKNKHTATLLIKNGMKMAFRDDMFYHSTPVVGINPQGEDVQEQPFLSKGNTTTVISKGKATPAVVKKFNDAGTPNRSFIRVHFVSHQNFFAQDFFHKLKGYQLEERVEFYPEKSFKNPADTLEANIIGKSVPVDKIVESISHLPSAVGGKKTRNKRKSKKKTIKGGKIPESFSLNINVSDYYALRKQRTHNTIIEDWMN
jgi:hypothetical protein